jgi:sugar phosphate isomerase/epimerase
MAPADFAALCNKYGLDLLSSHTNGTRPDAETWDYCIEWWKKAIADHKAAGMKYIVQPSLRGNWKTSLEDLDWNCKLFNEVGKMCAAEGIKFGFHNHAGEFTVMHDVNGEQMRVFDYILANTDPQYVFLELDLHWITEGGASAVEYFKANPGRFTLWHVKDKLEVGASGFIDFPAIYENATISGMAYQVIEQEAFTDGYTQFESIKQSCDYVKSMLPK